MTASRPSGPELDARLLALGTPDLQHDDVDDGRFGILLAVILVAPAWWVLWWLV